MLFFQFFFLCFCSFWTQLRDELWFDSEARCALASPNENAMNQNRFLSVSLSLCFPFNIPIYTIVLDFLNIQFVSKVKRLLFPQYTKTQTGTRPKKNTNNNKYFEQNGQSSPAFMLVFTCIRIWSAAYGRHYIQSFMPSYFWLLFFAFNSLSLSLCTNLAFISVQFSFPIKHGSLCLCELLLHFFFFEFLFVCLFDLSRYTKIDRKLILKFCFDWTWCQHTIWICRLIWKFYSWERKSDLLLGFSANSFVLSSLITKSAMHQWLPRNSI